MDEGVPVERLEIEVFLALAEELHFGRTAERLGVSQSRVSQIVKGIERRIGAPLFDRTSRRVALTPLGRQLRTDLELHGGLERQPSPGGRRPAPHTSPRVRGGHPGGLLRRHPAVTPHGQGRSASGRTPRRRAGHRRGAHRVHGGPRSRGSGGPPSGLARHGEPGGPRAGAADQTRRCPTGLPRRALPPAHTRWPPCPGRPGRQELAGLPHPRGGGRRPELPAARACARAAGSGSCRGSPYGWSPSWSAVTSWSVSALSYTFTWSTEPFQKSTLPPDHLARPTDSAPELTSAVPAAAVEASFPST